VNQESIIGIGIDQGIANCGFSIVKLDSDEKIEVLHSGTFVTKSTYPLPQRILILKNSIQKLIEEFDPDIIGCEKLFFNPQQKSTKKQGRNKSASMLYTNMATGVLFLLAGKYELPIKEFVPGTVKKALTGNGRSDKEKVEEAVMKIVSDSAFPLTTSHQSDSIAIGITVVKYFRANKEEIKKEHKHIKPRKKKGVK